MTFQMCPPVVNFPQQCGNLFFPKANCSCQAFITPSTMSSGNATISTIGSVAGNATITTAICQSCNPDASTLTFNFMSSSATFGFTASQINSPSCTSVGGVITTITVTGIGALSGSIATAVSNIPFMLTLMSVAGVCSYTLNINSPTSIAGVPTITVSVPIPCANLILNTCVTLPGI
jgi:hypothetical protein